MNIGGLIYWTENKDQPPPRAGVHGTRRSAACSIRDFLHRSDVPFQWIDLTSDEQARAKAEVSGLGDRRLPICEFLPREKNTIWRSMAPGRLG
jgi:hypothetical protein